MIPVSPYFISISFFVLWLIGMFYGGWIAASVVIFAFVVLPVLDLIMGVDKTNLTPEEYDQTKTVLWKYDIVLYVYALSHTVMLILGPWLIERNSFGTWEVIAAIISTGVITGGLGITVSHELCHRSNKWHRLLADFLLSSVCYSHFSLEHVHGHHTHVSTPRDPASARFNESFYAFYPRTVVGSFLSAWRIGKKLTIKKDASVWSLNNLFIRNWLFSFVWAGVFYGFFGSFGLVFFFAQAWVAFSLLELVNYVEHYGLERKQLENGHYERVKPVHSWNSSHKLSNYYLFNLERHSDHHAYAKRPYPLLRHHEEAPQLPAGYDSMIILALFPWAWFKTINPKVESFRN